MKNPTPLLMDQSRIMRIYRNDKKMSAIATALDLCMSSAKEDTRVATRQQYLSFMAHCYFEKIPYQYAVLHALKHFHLEVDELEEGKKVYHLLTL